uniref:Uncharacterized protein n=1 Tax=Lates calcarifer TaxID=8187 RepID=A0A4W6ECU6_LATCA
MSYCRKQTCFCQCWKGINYIHSCIVLHFIEHIVIKISSTFTSCNSDVHRIH